MARDFKNGLSISGSAVGALASTNPAALGAAAPGAGTTAARADHVHPTTGVVATTAPTITATFSKTGAITTGAGAARWYNHSGSTLVVKAVGASVGTAPTGASLIVDVNVNATTIYATQANRPTIAASGFVATGGTASTTNVTNGQYVTVDVDQIGSTVAGSDLVVTVWLAYA